MPAAGEIIQARVSGLLDGQLVENVIHMREVIEATTDEALALSLEALRLTLTLPLSHNYICNQTAYKRMTPIPLDTQFVPLTGRLVGGESADEIPNTVALVVTLRTGTAGKTHRGRMYLPGLGDSARATNRLSSTGLGLFNTMATSLLAQFGPSGTDANLRLGIYSRVIGGTRPMTLAGWQQVSQLVVQTILGNQRRRRPGVGA